MEIWLTFSSWKQDPTATLFSIGSNNNIEFSVRDLNKTLTEYKTYVAVVYDVDTLGKESRTIFVNGTQTSSIRLHNSAITLLSGSARRNEMTFIGTTATFGEEVPLMLCKGEYLNSDFGTGYLRLMKLSQTILRVPWVLEYHTTFRGVNPRIISILPFLQQVFSSCKCICMVEVIRRGCSALKLHSYSHR